MTTPEAKPVEPLTDEELKFLKGVLGHNLPVGYQRIKDIAQAHREMAAEIEQFEERRANAAAHIRLLAQNNDALRTRLAAADRMAETLKAMKDYAESYCDDDLSPYKECIEALSTYNATKEKQE